MASLIPHDLIAKFLSGNISDKEKSQLEDWKNADKANEKAFSEASSIWKEAKELVPSFEVDVDQDWGAVSSKMFGEEEKTAVVRPIKSRRTQLWRIAAVLVLALGATLWFFNSGGDQMKLMAGANETKLVELPDGSQIWLNQNSSVAYHKDFEKRDITLEGEAFFDVERDETSPFTIYANQTKVQVLGTSFNVRAYKSEDVVEVAVKTGKVSFAETITGLKPIILTAKEKGVMDKSKWELKEIVEENSNAHSWRNERMTFQTTPMPQVITDIERYFGIKLKAKNDDILNCSFTMDFSKSDLNLKNVFKVLEFTKDFTIEEGKEGYVILGEGCEE